VIEDYLERKEFTHGRVGRMFAARGFIAAPLMSKNGEVIGVIRALCRAPRKFTVQELDLFEQLANGAAIAVENSQLYSNLQISNKTKSEFLGVMSHELRTPLNVIMGYANLAKDDPVSAANEPHRHQLETIENHAKHLLQMINSIIEATQIESGAISVTKDRVNGGALFQELQAAYDCPQKDLELIWQLSDILPQLTTDYEKLLQVMKNLIDNAIKFTDSGTITLTVRVADDPDLPAEARRLPIDNATAPEIQPEIGKPNEPTRHKRFIEFTVQDTGIGIAEEDLVSIFDLFKQVDGSTVRSYEGVGLGLYFAKKYSELLHAEIAVDSQFRKGSTFTVRIPCDSPAWPA
jgi:signal transduction histidine kinase